MLGAEPGVALVAVGGYGRKELLPGSDLDVLMLHDGRDGIARIADRIWYPVWDSGAQLDHAVRTVPQARRVARSDLKVALGLLHARHVAGDADLTTRLREGALEDWRANARTRLAELKGLHEERTRLHGELAYLLEPDLKESRGGQRDVHAIQAIAAAWVAPAPGPKVRAAYEQILDARHVLHEVTGRRLDRLVLEEQDEVARTLGLLDGDALLRQLAGAGRTIAYAVDHAFRQADRAGGRRALGVRMRRGKPDRRPLADGVVEQDGEVVLARAAVPRTDPVLVLRVAAAAAQVGLPIAPRALARLAECPPLSVPWPPDARNALLALLGAGASAIAVWEALDQEGLLATLIPDWERVRNRPQRNPLHRFTVDRHLVECAANAAGLARDVSRPDLLLLAALLHDIGKGWPGDHSVSGEVVARDVCKRVGLGDSDVELVAEAVRHHLLLPVVATRRDLDDPMTVEHVATTVGGSRTLLELLHALADRRRARHRPGRVERLEGRAGGRSGAPGRRGARRRADARAGPAARGPAGAGGRWRPGRDRRRQRGHRGRARPARACSGGRPGCWPRTGSRSAAPTRPRWATPPSRCSTWCLSTATRLTRCSSPRTCGGCWRAASTSRTGSSAGPARSEGAASPPRRPRSRWSTTPRPPPPWSRSARTTSPACSGGSAGRWASAG